MSWLEALNRLNLPNDTYNYEANLVPTYVDGVNVDMDTLLKRLRCEYPWAQVSQINYNYLLQRYKLNIDRVEKHMYNDRNDSMVYMGVCECFHLNKMVLNYINQNINNNNASPTQEQQPYILRLLDRFYNECCNTLKVPSDDKSIVIINISRNVTNNLVQFLTVVAYMSLLNRKHLYPLMDIIIIDDYDQEDTEYDENNNVISSSSSSTTSTAADGYSIETLRKFKDRILASCCNKTDYRLYNKCNVETLLEIIANAHRLNDFYNI